MRRNRILLPLALAFAASAFAGEGRFEVVGEVAAEQVVAVPLEFDVYRACGAGEGRLGRELRVYDSRGAAQPYVIRRTGEWVGRTERRTLGCKIRDFTENGDGTVTLVAEFEDPNPDERLEITEVIVDTPLRDFTQYVSVTDANGTHAEVAAGKVYDCSRFAPVRNLSVAVAKGRTMPRRFRLTFRKPVTEVEKAEFERIVQTGSVTNQSVRRTVTEQAFRVDAVRVGHEVATGGFRPVAPEEVVLPGGARGADAFEYEGFSAPIVGGVAAPGVFDWAFEVGVLGRMSTGGVRTERWYDVHSIDLPGRKDVRREFPCAADPGDGVIRLRVDRKDNPPVAFGEHAFVFRMERREAVFVARPGEKYRLGFERGAREPQYLAAVRDYLERATDAKRLQLRQVGEFAAPSSGPVAGWLKANAVSVIGGLALVGLLAACLKMFGTRT